MKKNIIALRKSYKDGTSYLYGNLDFYVGNIESENVAIYLAAYEAKEDLEKGYVDKVNLCYVHAEWNFEVEDSKVSCEYELTPNTIKCLLANPMPDIRPTGDRLQILPDACYNSSLRKKLRKIRKNGKCLDWTKQDSSTEWDNNSWWYIHGELENKVHFDKATVINATAANDTVETLRWFEINGDRCARYEDIPYREMYINGIRECNVIGVHGDCLGFFWTTDERTISYDKGTFSVWNQRGLVVEKNDKKAVLQAYHGLLMKCSNL